jgi:rhomboid protease GluP
MSEIRRGDGWGGGHETPVILPPQAYVPPIPASYEPGPPAPARRRSPQWASAPATYVLGGINCLVFVLMCVNGASFTSPSPRKLLQWGADFGPFVLVLGQWWRLVTAMFVHIGVIHLATNMWCLWNLGLLGEPLVGGLGLIAAYLLTGFGGNLLSVASHPGLSANSDAIVGAGASGAVFGLAGLLIVLLKSKLLPLPEAELSRLRRSVIWFAVLNFVLGAGTSVAHTALRVDNMAHLGGFLTGLALAMLMVPKIGVAPALFKRRRRFAIGGIALALLLLDFGVQTFYGPPVAQLRSDPQTMRVLRLEAGPPHWSKDR